jgi:hypothetical protein
MQAGRRAWQRLKEWHPYSLLLLIPLFLLVWACFYAMQDEEEVGGAAGKESEGAGSVPEGKDETAEPPPQTDPMKKKEE